MKEITFGFTGKSQKIKILATTINHWWYILFALVGSATISISTSFVSDYDFHNKLTSSVQFVDYLKLLFLNPWFYLLAGIGCIIYGSRGTYFDLANLNKQNASLRDENEKVYNLKKKIDDISEDSESLQEQLSDRHSKLVITWLKSTSKQLKLNTYDRVTIYYYIKEHFYLLARHSQNPKFKQVHRQKFPIKYGVISQAWEHKDCVDTQKCPAFTDDPKGYIQHMDEKYGYNEEKIDKLTMKSCNFIAISINDADSHIGVIVFESEKKEHFKEQKVMQIKKYCQEYQSYMCDFIRDGIRLDKSAKVSTYRALNTDKEFLSQFIEEGE